jgi:ABC-type uncharacterized transport system substrate-binding protein
MPRKSVKKSSALNALKRNLAGKEGTAFEILDDVKKVNPNQWKSSSQVEQLARKYIDKLGLSVPEQRIQQFMDAMKIMPIVLASPPVLRTISESLS